MTCGLWACAPPPIQLSTPTDTGTADTAPTLRFLYPEPGEEFHVTDCTLDVPLIIVVENFDLVPFQTHTELVDGEGHWHGGLGVNIEAGTGYCAASKPYCMPGEYDAHAGLVAGRQNLVAYLADNLHADLDPPVEASVEINVIDDDGSCGTTSPARTRGPRP
ncbi:MAG: hypothetical protein H6738_14350 [Alphaproteobacteria bacterium]|nr:hypothetical protein [Alphaproteobacteria bacterium]MCB9697956.1 hypothetical protein [Alphaproteobacteria bacterium]